MKKFIKFLFRNITIISAIIILIIAVIEYSMDQDKLSFIHHIMYSLFFVSCYYAEEVSRSNYRKLEKEIISLKEKNDKMKKSLFKLADLCLSNNTTQNTINEKLCKIIEQFKEDIISLKGEQ